LEEKIALDNALVQFEALEEQRPLERREIGQFVDTHGRLGEYYYEEQEYLTARNHFTEAISRYERAREQLGLESAPRFGRIYARYGDLLYYVSREYEDARANFALAEANGYSSRDLDYKQGFIHYRNEDYQTALDNFFDAAGDYTRNRSVLYATANALYQRDSLGAAQGYYAELLEVLEAERDGIQNLLLEEDPAHRGLVEYLIKVQNNLGVTLQSLAQRSPDNGEVSSQGLVYLEAASEDAVNYNRDPQTGERAPSVNLAYLNMREILYPQPEYDLQIYTAIPKDLDDVEF
jgi:tetratricopeptide (TPR) repeat protein